MSGPKYFEERQVGDPYIVHSAAASTTLGLAKRTAHVTPPANSTATVVLPNVSQARGFSFNVHALGMGNTTSRIVVDYTNGTAAANTTGINTASVNLEFVSNGVDWGVKRT